MQHRLAYNCLTNIQAENSRAATAAHSIHNRPVYGRSPYTCSRPPCNCPAYSRPAHSIQPPTCTPQDGRGISLLVGGRTTSNVAGVCHSPGRTARISAQLRTEASTAGSSTCGASPGFVASPAEASPVPNPETSKVRNPSAFAARIFFMESSIRTHALAGAPTADNTLSKAAGSGLQCGITSSTAKTHSSGNRWRKPSASRVRRQ
mmetsp:Transcript_31965/g.72127  ORF Transcript_31965/g.72127 Transcript_31965/m.72127 type:complete len:205 (-) Transcript_31965:570-1184(-)